MPGAFDRQREVALVARTRADFAPGANLAALGQVTPQHVAVLVINVLIGIGAKRANAANRWSVAARAPACPLAVARALRATLGTRARWAVSPARGLGTLSRGRVCRFLIIHLLNEHLLECLNDLLAHVRDERSTMKPGLSDHLSRGRLVELSAGTFQAYPEEHGRYECDWKHRQDGSCGVKRSATIRAAAPRFRRGSQYPLRGHAYPRQSSPRPLGRAGQGC